MMTFDPATLLFNDAGLIPVIAQAEDTDIILMMAWMNGRGKHPETSKSWLICAWIATKTVCSQSYGKPGQPAIRKG